MYSVSVTNVGLKFGFVVILGKKLNYNAKNFSVIVWWPSFVISIALYVQCPVKSLSLVIDLTYLVS